MRTISPPPRVTSAVRRRVVGAWACLIVVAGALGFIGSETSGQRHHPAPPPQRHREETKASLTVPREFGSTAASADASGTDPASLEKILHETDADLRRFQLAEFLRHVHAANMPAVLAQALRFPASSRRDQCVTAIYTRWGVVAPLPALDSIIAVSPTEREIQEGAILAGWSESSVEAAFAWLEAHRRPDVFRGVPNLESNSSHYRAFINAQIKAGRIETMIHLIDGMKDDEFQPFAAGMIVPSWLDYDFDAAMAWLDKLPEGRIKNGGVRSAAIRIADMDPALAVEYAANLPSSQDRFQTLRAVVHAWAEHGDLAAAQSWLARQPPSEETDAVLRSFIEGAVLRDRDAAAAAIRLLSSSDEQFDAVGFSGERLAQNSPAIALDWTLRFVDVKEHFVYVSSLYRNWVRRDRAAASAYLDSVTGLTPEQIVQLRAMPIPQTTSH